MSQTQLMSTATASELLQSVGVELSIFALTLAVAFTFRGLPAGKGGASQKTASVPHAKAMQGERKSVRCDSHDIKRPVKRNPSQSPSRSEGLVQQTNSMIEHANRRQAAEAIAIYEKIKEHGDHANIKDAIRSGKHQPAAVFSQLIQCAGRMGRPDLIVTLLNDMVLLGIERSLGFYESTMKMLASKKYYKEALSVCSRLEADGLEPSPVTLSCLINFAVEIDECDRAVGFFNRLASVSTPSIRAYMTILRVYSRRQDWSKSLAVIRDMQKCQAPIDSLVLNIVLATGIAAHQLDATLALLKEFSQVGIADVVSYNTVMKGFAQQKEVNKAIRLLDEMSHTGVRPNAITFNTAMDAAIRSSRVADAWGVLAQMCDAGFAPDKFSCTTLIKGLQNGASAEQLTMILDLLRNVTAECDSTLCGYLFRNVIEAAAQVNDPALTARAVAQMREQRVILPSQEYQRLLQILMRNRH